LSYCVIVKTQRREKGQLSQSADVSTKKSEVFKTNYLTESHVTSYAHKMYSKTTGENLGECFAWVLKHLPPKFYYNYEQGRKLLEGLVAFLHIHGKKT